MQGRAAQTFSPAGLLRPPLLDGLAEALERPAAEEQLSVASAVFLLSSLSFGVGIFLLPSVCIHAGLIPGITLLVVFGLLSTLLSLHLLDVIDAHGAQSWLDVAGRVRGGRTLSMASLCLALVSGNAAHLQLVAGMLFDLIEFFVTASYGNYAYTLGHKALLLVLFVGWVLPYTFLDDIALLKHLGTAVSLTVLATCLAVVASCAGHLAADGPARGLEAAPLFPASWSDCFRAVPTVCFVYSSQFSLFAVYDSMRRRGAASARTRMRSAVKWAGAVQVLAYAIVCLVSLLTFGRATGAQTRGNAAEGNLLYNFPVENYPITALCLGLVFVIVLDYPVLNFPAVNALLELKAVKSPLARPIYSCAIALVVLVLDLCVPDLEDIFGLSGAAGCATFTLVLPGMILVQERGRARVLGVTALVVGAVVFVAGTFFVLRHIFTGH